MVLVIDDKSRKECFQKVQSLDAHVEDEIQPDAKVQAVGKQVTHSVHHMHENIKV